jgi:uncharacterized protein YcnI
VVTFGVGHGCEGADTQKVRIEIPEAVVSVRALKSDLGDAVVETDDAGLVTAVTWEKLESEVLEADTNYYTVSLRLKVPNAPFTTLFFPAYQTCMSAEGDPIEVAWIAEVGHDEEPPEGEEPAPGLMIVPARLPGWNKYTLADEIHHLDEFFGDALIVWKGDAAYSANPVTAELIAGTPDVTELVELAADDEIWVKY